MLILVPTPQEAVALFDRTPPIDERPVQTRLRGHAVEAALVGFGPVAAGVLAAAALQASGAKRAVLLGIAGTLRPESAPVGSVVRARSIRMGDVGRGRGGDHLGPRLLGLPQVAARPGRRAILEDLSLPERAVEGSRPGEVLTVAAASSTAEMARERARRYPDALVEEMEGFAVALACQLHEVDLTILRGVSNNAGDTDRGAWAITPALGAVGDAAAGLVRASGSMA